MKRVNKLAFFLFLIAGLMIFKLLVRSNTFNIDIFKACAKSTDLRTCREKYVISVLKKSGTKSAFLEIEKLKKKDAVFAVECHAFSHTIGVAAYTLLLGNVDVFSMPISACEIGYIHGLMMEIVMHKDDMEFARDFCEKLRSYSWRDRIYIEQCYHGVGHGLPPYLALNGEKDAKVVAKKDLAKLIKNSLDLCDQYFNSEWECRRGVFGGIATIFMGDHGLVLEDVNAGDIFDVCSSQSSDLRKSCYEMMAPALMELTQQDVQKAIDLSNNYILNQLDLVYMAQPLGSSITTSFENPSLIVVVKICRSFKHEDAVGMCIEGYATSIVDARVISDFADDILSVCDAKILNSNEYRYCRNGALGQAKNSISENQLKVLCKKLTDIERLSFCKS